MAKTIRIHNLAKELGVPSKAIIAKCNAEEVQPAIKNHMAAVSVGLAESIREWFSFGADVTTIEVARPVDLEKIQRKPKPKVETADADEATAGEAAECAVGVLTAEPGVVEEVDAAAEVALDHEGADSGDHGTASEVAAGEPAVSEAEAAPQAIAAKDTPEGDEQAGQLGDGAAEAGTEQAATSEPQPAPDPPPPPKPILPAGPKLVPKPAELQGPRVVRIEAPEPVRPARPRPRPRPAAFEPSAPTEPPSESHAGRARRGRKGAAARSTHSRSPRRHSSGADSMERLREYRDQDVMERKERLASATGHGMRARRSAERSRQAAHSTGQAARKAEVEIVTPIAMKDFCAAIGTPFTVVFGKLMEHAGRPYTINESLDAEVAEMVALDLGITLKIQEAQTALQKVKQLVESRERNNLQPRPPVVAMLGHVDHGKTSLLDKIRRTHVAAGEAGGITQHIGAYRIRRDNWNVTFLDTPGHEAFTAMRARGANMTDVVVLVVAADDGVMPQTIEAINHAKAAGVQIVVALNKIDLPGADLNRIYSQLSEHELVPSEWGGSTDVVKTSASTGEGIDDLVAHLSTLSELLDLKADPSVPATGTVIEAQMREGRGVAAQVLVREGTLKVGQFVVCGPGAGRVRTLLDDRGKRAKEAGPGTPVEVFGLDELPSSGDTLFVMDSLAAAKEIATEVRNQQREDSLQQLRKPQTLEDFLQGAETDELPELNVILRADVQGSVDVLKHSLSKFPSDKARLRILHAGVGAISEADVELARASKAVLMGFHVVADDRARQLADRYGIGVRSYRVIYEIHDDLHRALEGLLEPDRHEETRAKLEVREVFHISRVGTVAGCLVSDGTIARSHKVRLIRDGRIITENHDIDSLKRFKDDAREVRAGLECGIKLEGYDDIKPADVIEAYEIVEVAKRL